MTFWGPCNFAGALVAMGVIFAVLGFSAVYVLIHSGSAGFAFGAGRNEPAVDVVPRAR